MRDQGFQKYNLEAKYLDSNKKTDARTILLLEQEIIYKRRLDLEDLHISTIWVEVKISKRNSVLVCAYYRQWSLPNECNVSNSNSLAAQKDRYMLYTAQLDRVNKDGCDMIILTNENTNYLDYNCSPSLLLLPNIFLPNNRDF